MIIKKIEIPIYILKLEALLRRIPKDHPKREAIFETLAKSKAGYNGEKALEYHLGFLPKDKYLILHNLRLFDNHSFFQLDFLLLSPSFMAIIEVKNFAGTLLFDPHFNQLIRISGDKEEGFNSPILQVKRQQFQLQTWIETNNLTHVPIKSLVVISSPNTIIKANSDQTNLSQIVIHGANLVNHLKTFERKHQEQKLTTKEMRRISRLLVKKHTPLNKDVLQQFQISKTELLKGVQCLNCNNIPMKRTYGKWLCPICNHSSKDAHLDALKDYSLLISQTITNQELREFLVLTSESIAKKMLITLNLTYTGRNKARVYHLEPIRITTPTPR